MTHIIITLALIKIDDATCAAIMQKCTTIDFDADTVHLTAAGYGVVAALAYAQVITL